MQAHFANSIPRRHFLRQALATSLLAVASPVLMAAKRPKVLIVSTNTKRLGNNDTGTYLVEIAYPFQFFVDNGFEVDIVTPQGGKAAIYHAGATREDLARIVQSAAYIDKTEKTLAPADVKTADYAAIYYPGGHGQYFDVAGNQQMDAMLAAIVDNGGVVGCAGHGMASLAHTRLGNGKFLVEGKHMTCFPTWAEKKWMNISGYGSLLPFDMETVLSKHGAKLTVCTEENRNESRNVLIVDEANRFVTGAFAVLAKPVAEQMLLLMKRNS